MLYACAVVTSFLSENARVLALLYLIYLTSSIGFRIEQTIMGVKVDYKNVKLFTEMIVFYYVQCSISGVPAQKPVLCHTLLLQPFHHF